MERRMNVADFAALVGTTAKTIYQKIDNEFWYTILFMNDYLENIWKRFLRDWDDYIKDKDYFKKLLKEYTETVNWYSDKFNVYEMNVFEDYDYWNTIIELVLLSNYKYVRQ